MCQRDRACHLWGFNSMRLWPNKQAAFLTKVPINKVTHYPELAGGCRHLDFSQSEWLRRREALSLHWSGTVWRAKLKHEEQRYTLPHEGKWGNYSCRNHENTEAMRTVASNPRANRSITLSTNAGHNAGQRAARAAENAGNGGNFFFFFFCHNDMLVCQDGQRPWCDFKLSLLHEQRD